ncbi:MAG: rod shape-determining protein MreD [Paracoccaceae bacterium]
MADPIQTARLAYRLIYLLLAVLVIFLRLLPLDTTPTSWPGPNLLLCLCFAWVLRRPEYVPAPLVALVFLADDILSQRPPGLFAAIALLGSEFLRRREAMSRELTFLIEWLMVAGVMTAVFLAYRLGLAITFVAQSNLSMETLQLVSTVVAYPLVVGLTRVGFGLRKAATGEVDAMGRRL